jgi:radical SAM protein with 4Fe4S-binding SPASM domain
LKKESKRDCEIEKGVFGLEITTTEACNWNCKYCFERNHIPTEKVLTASIIQDRVDELFQANWFKEQYSGIKLILWGGEPTLNLGLCRNLMNAFMYDERVCFFIYTNGSKIHNLIDILRELKKKRFIKKTPKVTVQVSYDGNPIHDINRKDKKDRSTSKIAINAMTQLNQWGIDFGLKATMPWNCYHMLPQAWDDFDDLHKIFGEKIRYALTVDYYDVQFEKYKKIVEESLIKVAQKEIKFYKKYGYYLSNIFKFNRAFCATGKSMAVINTDGNVFYCHGAIYSKCSNELKYTNIFSKNFINSIKNANKFFYNNYIEPNECRLCVATSCLRCNVKKYEESNKETFKERWFDYPAQRDLCEYYKLVGKIGASMRSLLKE